MLARRLLSSVRAAAPARRFLSTEAAAPEKFEELRFNFAVPDRVLVNNRSVVRVTLPGRGGTMGVEKNMPPCVTELRPGVVVVEYEKGEKEEFFVPGGFAFKHANNSLVLNAPEGVPLSDIDGDRIKSEADALEAKRAAATKGSKEEAEALVGLEVYKSIAYALKVSI